MRRRPLKPEQGHDYVWTVHVLTEL